MAWMRQRDAGVIPRPPAEVWPWIADPARIALWNPNLERSGAPPPDRLREGTTYGARYRMSRRGVDVQATVEVWDPPRRLAVRYRWGPTSWALERSRLDPVRGGTRLTRIVEIRDPRMPWPARVLAGLLMRFGRPPAATGSPEEEGGSTIDAIRRLMEG